MMKMYNFEKNDDTYLLAVTKDYIVTNWNYKGICLLDKNFEKIEQCFVEDDIVINQFFVDYHGDKVALFCPENDAMFIFDTDTKQIKKIEIMSQLNLDEGSLTFIYYWIDSALIVKSRDGRYIKFCIDNNQVHEIKKDAIQVFGLDFYLFNRKIDSLCQNTEIINIFSQVSQLTYQNRLKNELGFIDCKNDKHITFEYEGDDIHALYFVDNRFIVVRCHTIESLFDGEKNVIMTSNEDSEFRRSVYDYGSKTIYVFSRYWRGAEQQMTLSALAKLS